MGSAVQFSGGADDVKGSCVPYGQTTDRAPYPHGTVDLTAYNLEKVKIWHSSGDYCGQMEDNGMEYTPPGSAHHWEFDFCADQDPAGWRATGSGTYTIVAKGYYNGNPTPFDTAQGNWTP